MDDSMNAFLDRSPIAERVKLAGRVIVQRTLLSPQDLLSIREKQSYGPVPKQEEICELEVGSHVIARGKIVRKRGDFYFKVMEIREKEEEV